MKKQITISVPEEQVEALACFLHKKDTTIEKEMEYALEQYVKAFEARHEEIMIDGDDLS